MKLEEVQVNTPIGNFSLKPKDVASICIKQPKITELRIQLGDGYATFYNCASLQEFFDKVQEYETLRKAFYVAHDALRYYRDKDYETDCTVADTALNEISEIMKGENNEKQIA